MSKRKVDQSASESLADRSQKRRKQGESTPQFIPERFVEGTLHTGTVVPEVTGMTSSPVGDEEHVIPIYYDSPYVHFCGQPVVANSTVCGPAAEKQDQSRRGSNGLQGVYPFVLQSPHRNEVNNFPEDIVPDIHDENNEPARESSTYAETVVLRVVDRIKIVEETVTRGLASLEMQLRGLRHSTPEPVCGAHERFELLVRSHADKLLYPRSPGPLAARRLDIPAAIEVLDFSTGCHPGPTINSFRIDPTSGPNSPWNIQACQVFAQDFCAQYPHAEGRDFMEASYEFHKLLPDIISHHAVASGFSDIQNYERFHEILSKRIRRHRLAESRLKITNEVQDLRGFLPVIRRLAEEDGMSSDEWDEGGDRRLHSTRPFWRHPAVTDWLHSIDSVGSTTVHSPARYEVKRQLSSKVDIESRVVKGLPVNFYDWNYLAGLDRSQYLDLDPKPAIALELNDSLLR